MTTYYKLSSLLEDDEGSLDAKELSAKLDRLLYAAEAKDLKINTTDGRLKVSFVTTYISSPTEENKKSDTLMWLIESADAVYFDRTDFEATFRMVFEFNIN